MHNYRVVILTLTYNRPENLKILFETLQKQTIKNFVWMIVNDGSSFPYDDVIAEIRQEAAFDVEYFFKENGGKASATNFGLNYLNANNFVLIVDDDEILCPDAVKVVMDYVEKYFNSNIGVIHFNRSDTNGKIIATPVFNSDFVMSFQNRMKKNYKADGYLGYFVEKIGSSRFPIFEGERYVGPSVLFLLVTERWEMLWSQAVLGMTNYLEGGLTKKGRQLRVESPKGMAVRALLMQTKDSGFFIRMKYSIEYYAYLCLAGSKTISFKTSKSYVPLFPIVSKFFGSLLYYYWNGKYLRKSH